VTTPIHVSACSQALSSATDELSALDVVRIAISTLEDQECLNAGYGSNLTFDGQVECDASVMEDQSGFGSIGAVSGSSC
jgi:taspase, threonine aspartase, 1